MRAPAACRARLDERQARGRAAVRQSTPFSPHWQCTSPVSGPYSTGDTRLNRVRPFTFCSRCGRAQALAPPTRRGRDTDCARGPFVVRPPMGCQRHVCEYRCFHEACRHGPPGRRRVISDSHFSAPSIACGGAFLTSDVQAHDMTDYAQRLSTPESYAAYGGPYGSGTIDGSEFQDQSAYEAAVRRSSPLLRSDTLGRQQALARCWRAVRRWAFVPRPKASGSRPGALEPHRRQQSGLPHCCRCSVRGLGCFGVLGCRNAHAMGAGCSTLLALWDCASPCTRLTPARPFPVSRPPPMTRTAPRGCAPRWASCPKGRGQGERT